MVGNYFICHSFYKLYTRLHKNGDAAPHILKRVVTDLFKSTYTQNLVFRNLSSCYQSPLICLPKWFSGSGLVLLSATKHGQLPGSEPKHTAGLGNLTPQPFK